MNQALYPRPFVSMVFTQKDAMGESTETFGRSASVLTLELSPFDLKMSCYNLLHSALGFRYCV